MDTDMKAAKHRAAELARTFIAGPDRSMNSAAQIENLLEMVYPDDADLQDLVICLACYRREGGPHLYNEIEMVELLGRSLPRMVQGTPA